MISNTLPAFPLSMWDWCPCRPLARSFSLFLFLNVWLTFTLSAQQVSSRVYLDDTGRLRYTSDQQGNYLPDFSQAGYKKGNAPIPQVPVTDSIGPIPGDNTEHIQRALDSIAARPLNEAGMRGALLLRAGVYVVAGTLVIRESGLVLRGLGDGPDSLSNTIIRAVGNEPAGRDVIQVGNVPGVNWSKARPGSGMDIISPFVPAGSRSLEVENPLGFQIGDPVMIFQRSTDPWLASINYGDTGADDPWSVGQIDLWYNRTIAGIDTTEGKVQLDVPIYDHLDRALAQSVIYILEEPGIKREVGVEQLRVDIVTAGFFDENHARNAIRLIGVEDAWVTDVTALHFTYAAVDTRIASRITVARCRGLDPNSEVTEGRRYNFAVGTQSNSILFTDCYASFGRHAYVSNGTSSVSGIVFHNSVGDGDYTTSEGHRRWSQGLLYDQLQFIRPNGGRLVGLYNRGSFGTGHGWSSVHSVAWNVQLPSTNTMVIQKPPGRQNYAIGCKGIINGAGPFDHPTGFIEASNQSPAIPSLYLAQLEHRLQFGIAPDAPARLSAQFLEDSSIWELSWLDIASAEVGYLLEGSLDEGQTFTVWDTLAANQTSYSVTADALATSSAVFFRIAAFNAAGLSPYSNPVVIEPSLVSLTEQDPAPFNLFPNPTQDLVWLAGNQNLIRVDVLSPNGKRLQSTYFDQMGPYPVSLKTLPTGLYILKWYSQSGEPGSRRLLKLE